MADQVSALEPGLYRATVRGVEDVILMAHEDGTAMTLVPIDGRALHRGNCITDARPLIVLDLEGLDVQTLADVVRVSWPELADAIEAQTKPARMVIS
jgi:hypothetical protein